MGENKEDGERVRFLKSFKKNVIGWGSYVSVEEWQKSNKLEDIQDLMLCNYVLMLDNTNLEVIPQ